MVLYGNFQNFKHTAMMKLFLLKPNFTDPNKDDKETVYFCPHSALFEGLLCYYPQLEKEIEIRRIDFQRPRPEVIAEIGKENQSCPVLIIDKTEAGKNTGYFSTFGNKLFVNEDDLIMKYLAEKFGIGVPH